MNDPNSGLPALTSAQPRQAIPPGEAFANHDPQLADLLARSHQARADAARCAFEWNNTRNGVTARQADRDYVLAALAEHGGTMPDDDLGPLPDWPATLHQLYVASWRNEIYADWLADQARQRATANRELVADLDRQTDDLRDEICALFSRARDAHDRGAYDRALDHVAPQWQALRRLYVWAVDPRTAYQPPTGRTFPAELELLEYEAATALGHKRIGVPIEALQRKGAPPSDLAGVGRSGSSFPIDGSSASDGNGGVTVTGQHRR